jgi:hypothetical protein
MKERPILFSAPMVRALLAGAKSQTRRIVKSAPGLQSQWLTSEGIGSVPHGEMIDGGWQMHHPRAGTRYMGVDVAHDSPFGWVRCPYGQSGDRLWVRETWRHTATDLDEARSITQDIMSGTAVAYMADDPDPDFDTWRPSIHMPRWASRITLEVTGVRVERLQEISATDARAEGIQMPAPTITPDEFDHDCVVNYRLLWEQINGPGSWDANPWVWVIKFSKSRTE